MPDPQDRPTSPPHAVHRSRPGAPRSGAAVRVAGAVALRARRRTWQAQQSAWLLLPLGGLAWVGFAYIGWRARRLRWLLASLLHLLGASAAVTALVAGDWWTVAGVLLAGGSWSAGVVSGLVVNPAWLRDRAARAPLPSAPWLPPLERAPSPAAHDVVVDPRELATQLRGRLEVSLDVAVRAGSALPGEALPLVRRVHGVAAPLLDRAVVAAPSPSGASAVGELELRDLGAIADEHLPAALAHYLSLPAGYGSHEAAPGVSTPEDALVDQLTSLVALAEQVRERVHEHDARELRVQAAYLGTKVRRSDLDL